MSKASDYVTVHQLKKAEPLADVPDEQLQWLIDNSRYTEYKDEDVVFKSGDVIQHTDIILKGKMRIYATKNGNYREIARIEKGDITGYLPFSRIEKASGDGQCTEDAAILSCPADKIKQAATKYYELTEALVHIMTSRVREYTALQQQDEKMISLGKLSAGLAHELNNPVAAIARSAASLQQQEKDSLTSVKKLILTDLTVKQTDSITDAITTLLKRPPSQLNMMERSDLEDSLMDWLDDNKLSSINVTDAFIQGGITTKDLDALSNTAKSHEQLSSVLNWLACLITSGHIIADISESSKRISDLVGAVKDFTYMDQASDRQFIDIHKGLVSTLTVLRYKITKANITVTTAFDKSLPEIEAKPGELNQVWTNLIDNAVDAMQPNDKGELIITTERDHEFIQIKVTDNGTGIPEDIQSNIFDPFFSTKQMGKGTGLGLDVVMQAIRRHNGSVKVKSVPGNTTFTICLPITRQE